MSNNDTKDPSLDLTGLREDLNQAEHIVPPGAEESKFKEIDKTGLEPSQDNTTPEGQIQDKGTVFTDIARSDKRYQCNPRYAPYYSY